MNITINFRIEYKTNWGQEIMIKYSSSPEIHSEPKFLKCTSLDGKIWTSKLNLLPGQKLFYKYQLRFGKDTQEEESLELRSVNAEDFDKTIKEVNVQDSWRSNYGNTKIFFSSAFKESIYKRENEKSTQKISSSSYVINLYAVDISKSSTVGVVGNSIEIGNWAKPQMMTHQEGKWTIIISNDLPHLEYKFVLIDTSSNEIIKWENGDNRTISSSKNNNPVIINNEGFRYGGNNWRGSGLAIPVFSLRSKQGMGIGEFSDLKLMIDLTKEMNMNFLQTLPVNDTIANKTWVDSYPYAAISVYALHPLYIHIPSITDISKYPWYDEYNQTKDKLNDLSVIDFEEVLETKTKFTQAIYEDLGPGMLTKKEIKEFISQNEWVKSYAVFCHLRDCYKTPNFDKWGKHSVFNNDIVDEFWSKSKPQKEVGYYVFMQYHLDKQLKEANKYGREKGVVLKGDLPIGIYRFSCDAWIQPNLYNMDQQAGAPPDDYAVNGQNWGFPTYNWDEMDKDQFSWWRSRMTQLSNYFDALRIDHILGFFRIWSIPMNQSSGTLGMFNPRLPFHHDELRGRGLTGDILRYTEPYLRTHLLNRLFGERAEQVAHLILEEAWSEAYKFKEAVNTQMKFLSALENNELSALSDIKDKILSLYTEVILLEEPNNSTCFNPRITVHTTSSYQELDHHNKQVIDNLYNDYFYTRHSEYWKNQALWKLPALINATKMFICGEDLGMIPSTVPQVMKALNIVPLEIQRMPKGNQPFGVCKDYDYTTVCSPSCHDMSTIRGWWESSYDTAKNYYRNYMGRYEDAPQICSTEIAEYIIQDHLHSPSMLAIFPIQDILAIDYDLRMGNPHAEQINIPANPKHYWRYRLHLNLEEIVENKSFCNRVGDLVKGSGRN